MKTVNSEFAESGAPTVFPGSQSPRQRRLRSNRLVLEGALGQRFRAVIGRGLAEREAHVLDLSIQGVRLALTASDVSEGAILLGDRLEHLLISCEGTQVYRGAGTVTRSVERDASVELGIALEHAAVDLAAVHRLSARQSVSQRWASALAECRIPVAPTFRAGIAELAAFLETAKSFLDREEAAMASWDLHDRKTTGDELVDAVARELARRLDEAGRDLGDVVTTLPKDVALRYHAFFESQVGRYFDCSPFLHRAKRKPLGYAGDYEMMNMLYRDHREGASLFGQAMNLYATSRSVARANINRIDYLGSKIRNAIERTPEGRARVASIGCGPAQEIVSFLQRNPELGARLDIALIDQEERAIAHCERALAPLAGATNARVRVIKESARRLLTDRKLGQALGTCDLIYSAGLFDYLADRSFSALLNVLYGALDQGGLLAVGNVAADNPDRWALEYLAEWYLHHRSPDDLLTVASEVAGVARRCTVESEPTGVNLFLLIEK